MWRKLRIVVLLFILATVAHRTWLQTQPNDWHKNFYVVVHPVNSDGTAGVAQYLATLDQEQFEAISAYLAEESQRFGLNTRRPFEIQLGPPVADRPPQPPQQRSMLDTVFWSLGFRWWAWRHSPSMPVKPDIRLYLLYYDSTQHTVLPHSTALSKGRIGLVNVFADAGYAEQNAVIIAHELLHTLGASDKYNLADNLPLFPAGFAEPEKEPLYPQEFAELMAGRRPLTAMSAEIPAGLTQVLIGEQTAREIGWTK